MYKREPLEGHNALDNSQQKAEIVENPTNESNVIPKQLLLNKFFVKRHQ